MIPLSPMISSQTPSPSQQYNSKAYIGCTKFEDYIIESKLGEGTFGYFKFFKIF